MPTLPPQPLPLSVLMQVACRASSEPGLTILFAGTPTAKSAPGGMGDIIQRSGQSSLGVSGGLTLIKSAAAFTAPSFVTRNDHRRIGNRVEHYACVERTSAQDATHESYYPAPGDHLRPGMTQQIGGRTYNHHWRISPQVSQLIRQGEQEHLDDASRAYELTYKRIENEINALAGQRFGPASTPGQAALLAEQSLSARLPRELGTDPAQWVRVLDRLLTLSRTRDANGWHGLAIDPPVTDGTRIIHPVSTAPATRIGSVPSNQVVNF